MRKSVWILLSLVLVAALGGCQKTKKSSSGPRFQPVQVRRDNIQITVLATGNVQPQNQLNIKPPISGRIEKILISEGDYVKKGQMLAQLSSTERAALLDTARAQGPEALARWQDLYLPTALLSPQSGQIIYLPTVPGQVVSTGDTIMVMSNHLIVNTQVDETDLAQVKMDQNALITLDAYPDKPVKGKVRRISFQSTLVNNVTTYQVDVWPNEIPSYMRSGMTANVVFNVAKKDNALVVPSDAVQQSPDGQSYVLTASADPKGKPQTQVVQTGLSDGKQLEVVSGLKEGDKVLIKSFSAGQVAPVTTGTNPFMPSRPAGGGGARGGGGGGGGGGR